MSIPADVSTRFATVKAAFQKDGFKKFRQFPDPSDPSKMLDCCVHNGRFGVCVDHATARNGKTGAPKRAYYVEGDSVTMGWLLGYMGEPELSRMATDYVDNVVFSFFDINTTGDKGPVIDLIKGLIVDIADATVQPMKPDIPKEYAEEIEGLYQGALAANPETPVTTERLWILNLGIDGILSHVYTGEIFAKKGVSPKALKVPLLCNGFAAPGEGGRRFFGRDFMFPTAEVFQDVACLIVYRPDAVDGAVRLPFASQTAPGIVGCLAAVNSEGVGIGVDVSASYLCDPARPGFNSLLLNRHCMQYSTSAAGAVDVVKNAQRGVSWLYVAADAEGKSVVIEAGKKMKEGARFPYRKFIPPYYKRSLPRVPYIRRMQKKYGTPVPDQGLVARDAAYHYPTDYITDWNKRLWNAFDRNICQKLIDVVQDLVSIVVALFSGTLSGAMLRKMLRELFVGAPYSPDYFGQWDYINKTWTDENCPGPFYFAPQRETKPDVVVVSNTCISPEMRLVGMNEWTAIVAGADFNDFQWRYDELCNEVQSALDANPDGLNDDTAWSLINFLNPDGKFPTYYNRSQPPVPWKTIEVKGSVSLCDLTARRIKSLYGYYGDEPVHVTLPEYLK